MARRRKTKKQGYGTALIPAPKPESTTPKVPQEFPAETVGNTRRWARALHATDVDKDNKPYIGHLEAVMHNVYALVGFDKDLLQVALLHDTIEDTAVTKVVLEDNGYNPRVVATVSNVTKMSGEPNWEYIGWVIDSGTDAMIVKLADLYHNTREDRLATQPPATKARLIKKYYPAIWRLEQALLASGIEITETMTYERAVAAVRTYNGPQWRESTSPGVVMKGDLMKFTEEAVEDKFALRVKSKTSTSSGYTFAFEDTDTKVTMKQGDRFWIKWGGNNGGTSYGTASATPTYTPEWIKYMGLPRDYVEGDDLPDPLETFIYTTAPKTTYKGTAPAPGKGKVPPPGKPADKVSPATIATALEALGFDGDATDAGLDIYAGLPDDGFVERPVDTKSFSQMLDEVDHPSD